MTQPVVTVEPAVLVLRALGLGDALTAVAALRGVRRAWPGRRLVLAGPAGVGGWLRDLGVVDEVLDVPGPDISAVARLPWTRTGHVAVNLHGRGPQSHRLLEATGPERLVAFATAPADESLPDGVLSHAPVPDGVLPDADAPPWRSDEHEVDRWCRLVRSAGGPCDRDDLRLPVASRGAHRTHGPVVVHPGAASGSRRWPADRWASVIDRLAAVGNDVLLTGGPGEAELCAGVHDGVAPARRERVRNTAGALDLPGLAGLVADARLLLCGDTGVGHLATALQTPSVLLFGPTAPQWWGPAIDPHLHTVLWHGDPARPGDPHSDALDPALAEITVEEVLEAATRFVTRPGART